MNTLELILVSLCCLFAAGSGISVGWILCDRHRRSNPEGVAKVAAAAASQVELARADSEKQVERMKSLFDETKAFMVDQLAAWQAHASTISRVLSSPPPPPVPDSPPEPPRTLDPEQSAARVLQEGVSSHTALRDALMQKAGLTAEKADAILDGKLDDLPPDQLLSDLVDGVIRDRTGAV